nr:tellurite resistance TerB family protein [Methylobacterium sp. OTU13CASTA1]
MSEVQQAGPGDSAARSMVDALVRTRRTGLAATAALGGLALVAALATKALRGAPAMQSGDPNASDPKSTDTKAPAPPGATPFDHITVGEDEARTMLRAMVAATLADGLVDAGERKRLDDALSAAGIEADGRRWLEAELADPADVDDIAERATNPEQAARIYAAARLAIDPDTLQERKFLQDLAEALDLPVEATERLEAELAA